MTFTLLKIPSKFLIIIGADPGRRRGAAAPRAPRRPRRPSSIVCRYMYYMSGLVLSTVLAL